jgi:carbamoyl-phosphate synthase large subunit
MDVMINVLMTGAGAPGGPGIIKALLEDKMIKLVVCDMDEEASGRWLCDRFYKIPSVKENGFLAEIIRICNEEEINIIFPLVTLELFVFSKNKALFRDLGVKVIVSDYSSLEIANDKSKLYQHLKMNNIIVPAFEIVNTTDKLISACKNLGYPQKSVCIKPAVSNGSRGVRVLTESIDEYDLLFNYKPQNLFSTLPKILEILDGRIFPDLLVSEYLPGDEYTIDTYVFGGKSSIILPRLRSKMSGGISVKGVFENIPQIVKYTEDVISSMQLHGPIGIQVKQASDGLFKILEINPRIQGTSVSAIGAGINLPLLAVRTEFFGKLEKLNHIKWGTKFVRYFDEVYFS